MLIQLIRHRRTIWYFALRQLEERYAGTWAGLVWTLIHPLMLLAVFWFVFEKGLRVGSVAGRPYILDLFCGLVPWMLVAESLSGAAVSITGRSYLVKKIAFPCEILPFTNIAAALLPHLLLGLILFGMLAWYGRAPANNLILLPYYLLCMLVLVAGIAMLVSAANVFYRDVGQVVGVVLNLWFWVTPIVWPVSMLPPEYLWLVELNPLAYVVQGYRDSLLESGFTLPKMEPTIYFWAIAGGTYFFSQRIFMRLKPGFADVL